MQTKKLCSVGGCARTASARGWCHTHYMRWRRNGTVEDNQLTHGPLAERLWRWVDKSDGCWTWTGASSRGYGRIDSGPPEHRSLRAHRVAYELLVGPIPTGMVLDHLCRNTLCVRPTHLEPVTSYVNVVARGTGPNSINRPPREHCFRGHALTPENTYTLPGTRQQTCRACRRERRQARKAGEVL